MQFDVVCSERIVIKIRRVREDAYHFRSGVRNFATIVWREQFDCERIVAVFAHLDVVPPRRARHTFADVTHDRSGHDAFRDGTRHGFETRPVRGSLQSRTAIGAAGPFAFGVPILDADGRAGIVAFDVLRLHPRTERVLLACFEGQALRAEHVPARVGIHELQRRFAEMLFFGVAAVDGSVPVPPGGKSAFRGFLESRIRHKIGRVPRFCENRGRCEYCEG